MANASGGRGRGPRLWALPLDPAGGSDFPRTPQCENAPRERGIFTIGGAGDSIPCRVQGSALPVGDILPFEIEYFALVAEEEIQQDALGVAAGAGCCSGGGDGEDVGLTLGTAGV